MICDARNAYPNNTVIDANVYADRKFGFDFYGSYCIGADVYLYNAGNMSLVNNAISISRPSGGRYNGEEITFQLASDLFTQNHDYVWNARIIQSVDIANGNYPSNLVTSGKVKSDPYITTEILTAPSYASSNQFICVALGLNIELPAYVYYRGIYQPILSYQQCDSDKALIKVNSKYTTAPTVGDSITICKTKSNSRPTETDIYVPIDTDNAQLPNGSNEDYYKYWLTTNFADTSETNRPYAYWLKINNQYRKIYSYSRADGICKITEKFVDSDNEPLDTIPEGTPYEIFSVMVWTPYFYTSTKATPVATTSLAYENELLHCSATITNRYYDIKYYYWNIWYQADGVLTLLDTSCKIYNARLDYYCKKLITNGTYYAECFIVTQDNKEVETELDTIAISSLGTGVTNLTATFDNTKNAMKLNWNTVYGATSYVVLRKNNVTNDIKLLYNIKTTASEFYDYTCECEGNYTYYVTAKSASGVYSTTSVTATVDFNSMSIYFLKEAENYKPSSTAPNTRNYYEMYGDRIYRVEHFNLFPAEVKMEAVNNNLSATINNTYAKKPVVTYGNSNYDSFSVTFDFLKMTSDCEFSDYDYNAFEAWRKYIDKQCPVMIKDMKGNVWFGAITSHSFNVEYDIATYMPYNVTIEFTQTRDMNKTQIDG